MDKKDWYFEGERSICNFRAVGVLLRGDKILLQSEGSVYALPGGHVIIGETAEETVIREYKEETGADIICNRLIWIKETFWEHRGKKLIL
ncbi:NUDIX domain-containing protein [Clostridiaceae bacterium OttesenSCG-928-D20]|nr:NUDIX domain-containing protein [Clostridiaceae bacterium OttesenSCG-928-D20]